MYKTTVQQKKLNVKKLFATVIIGFILFVISVICIYNNIEKSKIKKATLLYSNQLTEMKKQEEIESEEEKKKKAEAIENKYKPLSQEEINKMDNIYAHRDQKRVLLTFDDGPTETVTPFILDLLKQEKVKATFFVLGKMVERYPKLVKREYDEGHFIANHSYTHSYSDIYQSTDTVFDEYNRTNEAIKKAVGNPNFNSLIFRFPGGSYGGYYADIKSEAKQKLKEQGITSLDWNALTNDADGANTKEAIMENFHETIQDKTSIVILMHDASDKILTYETLPDIIKYLRENGYEFQTVFDAIGRTEWKKYE